MSKVREAYVPRPDGVFVDGQLVTPPSKTPANGPGTDDSGGNIAALAVPALAREED